MDRSSPSSSPQAKCLRCGTCCKKGGPTLHTQDAGLVPGAIPLDALVTYRKGELAYHPTLGRLIELPSDMIKIKGKGRAFTCIFYDDGGNACSIYAKRPIECKALECWNPGPVMKMFLRELLQRHMILETSLLEVIGDYDTRFPPTKVLTLVINGEHLALARMEEEDTLYRSEIVKRGICKSDILDLLLGRPIAALRAAFKTLS